VEQQSRPRAGVLALAWAAAIRRNDLVQLLTRAVWVEANRTPRVRRAL
jgi:hypothetical protein